MLRALSTLWTYIRTQGGCTGCTLAGSTPILYRGFFYSVCNLFTWLQFLLSVLLYVREKHESVFTALMLRMPTLHGLAMAVSLLLRKTLSFLPYPIFISNICTQYLSWWMQILRAWKPLINWSLTENSTYFYESREQIMRDRARKQKPNLFITTIMYGTALKLPGILKLL